MPCKIASHFSIGGRRIQEDATNEELDISGPNEENIIPEIHLKVKVNGVDISENNGIVNINRKRNDEPNRKGEHKILMNFK